MLVLIFALGTRPGELCGLSESDLTPQRVPTLNRGLNKYGNTSDLNDHGSASAQTQKMFRGARN